MLQLQWTRAGQMILAMLLMAAAVVQAAEGPRALIAERVDTLTERIENNRQKLEKNKQFAREMVREQIGELVDFKRITRLVMAEHFSDASREQKYRFLETFRESLINTYASGVTMYEGQTIRVLPAEEGDVKEDSATVRMEIRTREGEVIPIRYSLFRNSEDEWKVQNVIVNGLNLGKTFRSQFDQAVRKHEGDIDKVIDTWSTELDVEGDTDDEGVLKAAEES